MKEEIAELIFKYKQRGFGLEGTVDKIISLINVYKPKHIKPLELKLVKIDDLEIGDQFYQLVKLGGKTSTLRPDNPCVILYEPDIGKLSSCCKVVSKTKEYITVFNLETNLELTHEISELEHGNFIKIT